MNLQSYGISGVLDTLEPAEMVGLPTYIFERPLNQELVVIGAFGGEPRAYTSWPMAALTAAESRMSLARDWAGDEFDAIYLIGYHTEADVAASAVVRARAALDEIGVKTVTRVRSLAATRTQWAFADDVHRDDAAPLAAIVRPNPAQGRLEALLFRAACRKRYAARVLRPLDGDRAATAERIAAKCRADRAEYTDPALQADHDERLYRRCMADPLGPSMPCAIALGIAAVANPDVVSDAIDDILEGSDRAHMLWCQVARETTGTERATAAALAALSAWSEGDEVAIVFAEIALDADPDGPLAWTVWNLTCTGTAPESVRLLSGAWREGEAA
ncbi:DUF4192 family protein [Glycomyces tenuis]|uniref:DUF4192 family protein n=1 Tax=Glycomyces tenuis TaxID=58116 RepID=UPI00041CD14D|nr:DUF4192 family protein [Glycomyces tenuis]